MNKPSIRQQIGQRNKQKAALEAHVAAMKRQAEAPRLALEKFYAQLDALRRQAEAPYSKLREYWKKQDDAAKAQTLRLKQELMGLRSQLRRKP
jgi:ubiquinone biosynthesis protein UbiJ